MQARQPVRLRGPTAVPWHRRSPHRSRLLFLRCSSACSRQSRRFLSASTNFGLYPLRLMLAFSISFIFAGGVRRAAHIRCTALRVSNSRCPCRARSIRRLTLPSSACFRDTSFVASNVQAA